MRSSTLFLRGFTMLLALSSNACSDSSTSGSNGMNSGGGIPPIAGTGCPLPTIPEAAFSATTSVVGSGSADSCTESALVAAVGVGGSIRFSCGAAPVTITLSAELAPSKDVSIDGGGLVTFSGGDRCRIVNMDKGGALNLRLRNLSLVHAASSGDGGAVLGSYRGNVYIDHVTFDSNLAGAAGEQGGGGLYLKSGSHGVIIASTFVGNRGGAGGAIHSLLSDLKVADTTFQNNDSTLGASSGTQNGQPGGGYGAAIYIDGAAEPGGSGAVAVCGSHFLNNRSAGQGGAIFSYVYNQQVTIERSLFQGNSVVKNAHGDALGGALRHGNGPLQLLASTLLSNSADDQGGGLWLGDSAQVTAENVTLFGNHATTLGGGGMLASGNLTLRNATLVSNEAGSEGGAILGDNRVSMSASIVANNRAGNQFGIKMNCSQPGNLGNSPPPVLLGSGNLEWPTLTNLYNNPYCTAGELVAEPLLAAAVLDNGGPVPTLALTVGSPALGAGSGCASQDARGMVRPSRCDLGAYQLTQ